MGWFDSKPTPQPTPAPKESKYSHAKVETLLTRFGQLRIGVTNPRMKVLITQITWGTLPYLNSLNGGKPEASRLADIQTTLDMLIQTVEGYITIQNGPVCVQTDDLMSKGFQALYVFWNKISTVSPDSLGDTTAYLALTGFLASDQA